MVEALYAYLPGTWTYRQSGRPMKTKAYHQVIAEEDEPNRLLLPLWDLVTDDEGRRLHGFVSDGDIPLESRPWGVPLIGHQQRVPLLRPTQLNLMNSAGQQNGHKVRLVPVPNDARVNDDDDTPFFEMMEKVTVNEDRMGLIDTQVHSNPMEGH